MTIKYEVLDIFLCYEITQKKQKSNIQLLFNLIHRRPVKNETTATTTTAPKIDGTIAIPASCGPQ